MYRMELHYPVDRSCVRYDIERLDVVRVIMLHGYDASELDKVVVLTVNRILEITFINAIALFGYGAGYTIP
jgi:hypothetical protein